MEKINILIVDDKLDNIIALEALLQRGDVDIISTTLPNDALRICWEQDIAIALVDVQMPEMDGFELVEILKSNPRTKDILVIFVTAISIETKYAVKGLNAGAVDYLYKPLNPYVTSAKVDSFIQLVRNQREIERKNKQLEQYQKELIQAKEHAERGKRSKEFFLANMSHEIRTPINGIIGLTNVLKQTELSKDQSQLVELLQTSSTSLLAVINDVLDISKIESGKFRITRVPTDLKELCTSIVNLLAIGANEKDIRLILDVDIDIPNQILADPLRLNQILMNLIGNAIKFTHDGSVTLKVEILNKKGNNLQIRFSVVDTGIGIAEENIDKIFENFEQADERTTLRFGGTGLGLSIVKSLAKLKGGTLKVESKENRGSVFMFTNWYEVIEAKPEVAPTKAEQVKTFTPFDSVRVLLAEDNLINKFLVIKILTNWNISVDCVENGEEVIAKLKESSYDLIIMDTYMPVLGGLETIKMIRAGVVPAQRDIPIINLSSAVLEADVNEILAAGANDILDKSFDLNLLYDKISNLVLRSSVE